MGERFVQVSRWKPALRVALGLALIGAFSREARGQTTPCDATRWAGVPTVSGTLTINAHGSASAADGSSLTLNETINTSPNMAAPPGNIPYVWSGPMNANVNYTLVSTDSLGQVTTIDGTGGALTGLGTPGQMYLSIDPVGCTYTLAWDGFVNAQVTNSSGTSTQVVNFTGTSANAQPLPAVGTTLTGTYAYTDSILGIVPVQVTITWTLAPGAPNLDLVVKLTDYATWAPSAGASEKDTGLTKTGQKNYLLVQAVLQNPDGSTSLVAPDSLVLELVSGSSEPGVSMNWPGPGSATNDADLTFEAIQSLPAFPALPAPTLSQNKTVATFSNIQSPPLFFVNVAPHDWGGWATLNVRATFGTQQIVGHLEGDKTATDILLPKRSSASSHIASVWLSAMGLSASADDASDAETTPSNSNNGDGLTLYEEYRGFAVKCPSPEAPAGPQCAGGVGHIYGNPNKKDLFVVVDPQLGSEVTPGILNFQTKAKLKVHYAGMTTDYVNGSNVINFNHGQGSHLVDQHAVQIKPWGLTMGCTAGGPGTPMDVKQINVPHLSTIVSEAQKLGQSAERIAVYQATYPRLTSHELGHAVDISHHGEVDPKVLQWSTTDGNVITETAGTGAQEIIVFTEQQDLMNAASLGIAVGAPRRFYVGKTNGQHSGDTKCFMRYGSSAAYMGAGGGPVRYLALETPDFGLTNTTTGTGVNASSHVPQPRYGDAAGGRGDCQTQLCVSDLVHADSRQGKQPTCP